MSHYAFTQTFRSLYTKALELYAAGQRGSDTYFDATETAWLTANGLTAQHLYDYAEDEKNYGEPAYDTALGIELLRRDYFLNVQLGRPSPGVLDESTLPPKNAAIEGVEWLPRIIPKARAKLRGELPLSLMYCCGGDRRFFKQHDIHPTEFLHWVWHAGEDSAAVVTHVLRRSIAVPAAR